jgi:hypothetical protein
MVVGGTLKDPTVGPAVAPIAARVGVAAALAAVAPPLAILPFIDFGGAPDADCRGLLSGKDSRVPANPEKPAGPKLGVRSTRSRH